MPNREAFNHNVSPSTLKDIIKTWLVIIFFTFSAALFLSATKSDTNSNVLSQIEIPSAGNSNNF